MTAVCIATYNHERYIEQAVRSVLAQQCEEELRIYIGDDASTDRTADICRQLARADKRIVYLRREKNRGLTGNTLDLYRRALNDGCTYIAMLDGDDYWTDSKKLQKQLDYMKAHPESGIVHTAAYDEVDGTLRPEPAEAVPTGDISRCYNLRGARTTNCTVVFRADLLRQVDLEQMEAQHFPIVDYPLYGLFSQRTEFGYIQDRTAAWRCHVSVSQPASVRRRSAYLSERIRMWRWLENQYPGQFHFRRYKAIFWYMTQFFYFLFAQIKKKL